MYGRGRGLRHLLPCVARFRPRAASGDVIFIPISRRDMAIYLATTAETISRTIQLLAKQKIIDILDNRHFRLNNLDALRRISASSTPTPTPGHRPPMPPTFLGNRH